MTLHLAEEPAGFVEKEVTVQKNVATGPAMGVQPRRPEKHRKLPRRPRKHRKLPKLPKRKRRGRRESVGN